jgi:hypothetical protein
MCQALLNLVGEFINQLLLSLWIDFEIHEPCEQLVCANRRQI